MREDRRILKEKGKGSTWRVYTWQSYLAWIDLSAGAGGGAAAAAAAGPYMIEHAASMSRFVADTFGSDRGWCSGAPALLLTVLKYLKCPLVFSKRFRDSDRASEGCGSGKHETRARLGLP